MLKLEGDGMRVVGLAATVVAMLMASPFAARAAEPTDYGVWRNPKNSVHVHVTPCGSGQACGTVVWANEKAQRDAREGGTAQLIGLQLFRNFTEVKPSVWRGRIFIPDLNRTFAGTAEVLDPRTIRASGCAVPRVACKAQVWVRID